MKNLQAIPSLFLRLASILITICLLAAFLYLYLESQLPDVNALKELQLQVPLKVFSQDGKLIAEYGEIRRTPVPLAQIPKPLIQAVLATEDQRFYEHAGVDFFGLMRAATQLALTGTKSQGGSTITMQVARNFYLSRKKTFARKINEILLAMKIDRTLSKQKILELYLNKIYLGNRAYGVAAAAQIYYGKSLQELTLAEMAMLAGLPKAPSTINPIVNPIAAKIRRNHVLNRMLELGYISKSDYLSASNALDNATYHGLSIEISAPYVGEMVRDLMVNSYGEDAYTKGYQVYTTVDSRLQMAANRALRNALLAYDQRHGYRGSQKHLGPFNNNEWRNALQAMRSVNGLLPAAIMQLHGDRANGLLANGETVTITNLSWAKGKLKIGDVIYLDHSSSNNWRLAQIPQVEGALVAIAPNDGAIKSLTGGFDYTQSNFNRAVQARRQPGSSFKPFIYAAALEKGYTLATIVNDAPVVYNAPGQAIWRPQNSNRDFLGPIRMRLGLVQSRNMVSIRILEAIGIDYAIDYAARFGFDSNRLPRNLSLALGTADITPLESATGYAVFANGGYKIAPYLMNKVVNAQGKVLYRARPQFACSEQCIRAGDKAPAIIPPSVAFLMTSAMQDVIRSGTGQGALALGRHDLAGKTGTTNDNVDTWFCGFNSDIVAAAWVGFDQPSSLHEYGAQAALPMWVEFMRTALQGKPEHTMPQPADVITARIDPVTGLLARPDQQDAILEYFRNDTVPQQEAPVTTPEATSEPEPLF